MKSGFFIALCLLAFIGCAPDEKASSRPVTAAIKMDHMEIDQAIEMAADEKQKQFLYVFKERFSRDDDIKVTSHGLYFEIIVSHPSQGKLTGGAEQYFVDKKTGQFKMGWHEHPMEMTE